MRALETGVYETRGVRHTQSPSMDIQVSSNFERLLFEANGRDGARIRAMMDTLKQSRGFTIPEAALAAIRAEFDAAVTDEAETRAEIARCWHQSSELVDPHTAVGIHAARRRLAADPATPMVVLGTAHAAKFPDAIEAAIGLRPPLPAHMADLLGREERFTVVPNDQAAIERFIPRPGRSRPGVEDGVMSPQVSELPSGLRVVTDSMPHLETASLGVWIGAGSRHERAHEQGLSHLLEHMAFKGTSRRSAQAIAEDIEAAGGDLNAATGVEQTAYYAAPARLRHRPRPRHPRRHPDEFDIPAGRTRAGKGGDHSGDRRGRRHAG